jgi:hypothetical protein
MLHKKDLLDLVGFHEECAYNTLLEFNSDPDHLFNKDQQLKLECFKCIAKDIADLKNTDCNNKGDSNA